MPIISAHKNDIGLNKKRANEDYIWVDEQAGLFIVADGMGGYEGGEIASQLAATTTGKLIAESLTAETRTPSPEALKVLILNSVEAAHKAVYDTAQETDRTSMGTTIVLALVRASTAYISHVGDSRAYLLRGSTLTQLTEDDSWGNFAGKHLGAQKKQSRGIDHILTQALGQNSSPDPSFISVPFTAGDCLLLCSDGLWNMIDDDHILAELQKAGDQVDLAVEALIEAANAAGGRDNISVIVIKNKDL